MILIKVPVLSGKYPGTFYWMPLSEFGTSLTGYPV
jgi:hypothetical protein